MSNLIVKPILCWTLSLVLSFLPAVRIGAATGCDNAAVAGVLFDHLSTAWLSESALTKFSRLSVRELQEIDPTAELQTLKTLWQSIQLMTASEAKRLDTIEAAKAQFVEAVAKDKEFIERLEREIKLATKVRKTELNLSSLNERFGLIGPDRITALGWTDAIAARLENINLAATLQRYLGDRQSVNDFITLSANGVPFRRWMISNILHPNDEFHALFRRAILDSQNQNIPIAQIQEYLNFSDQQLGLLARSLYQYINNLPVDTEYAEELIYHLFNHYALQMIKSQNLAQLTYQFAQNVQKIDPTWAAARLQISSQTPESLRGLVPMIYTARNQITAANNGRSFLESLLFYELVTNPPSSIANRLPNFEAFETLISHQAELRFGGYIQAQPANHALNIPNPLRGRISIGLAILQIAYVIASAGGFTQLAGWPLALMNAYMLGLRPNLDGRR